MTLNDLEYQNAQAAISKDLPGWKLSENQSSQSSQSTKKAATASPQELSVKKVGDLEQLKKKFLGKNTGTQDPENTASSSSHTHQSPSQNSVLTVMIEPVNGGMPKVADIVNGRATIVQG